MERTKVRRGEMAREHPHAMCLQDAISQEKRERLATGTQRTSCWARSSAGPWDLQIQTVDRRPKAEDFWLEQKGSNMGF